MKRDKCLVCGELIPYHKHLAITYINGAECPKCHSYMKFSNTMYLSQFVLFILLIFSLNVFSEKSYLIGTFLLIIVLATSVFINYFAKYKIDPAHKERLENGK